MRLLLLRLALSIGAVGALSGSCGPRSVVAEPQLWVEGVYDHAWVATLDWRVAVMTDGAVELVTDRGQIVTTRITETEQERLRSVLAGLFAERPGLYRSGVEDAALLQLRVRNSSGDYLEYVVEEPGVFVCEGYPVASVARVWNTLVQLAQGKVTCDGQDCSLRLQSCREED